MPILSEEEKAARNETRRQMVLDEKQQRLDDLDVAIADAHAAGAPEEYIRRLRLVRHGIIAGFHPTAAAGLVASCRW